MLHCFFPGAYNYCESSHWYHINAYVWLHSCYGRLTRRYTFETIQNISLDDFINIITMLIMGGCPNLTNNTISIQAYLLTLLFSCQCISYHHTIVSHLLSFLQSSLARWSSGKASALAMQRLWVWISPESFASELFFTELGKVLNIQWQ